MKREEQPTKRKLRYKRKEKKRERKKRRKRKKEGWDGECEMNNGRHKNR